MADPEKPPQDIPLQEAVARDLIPCAMCGARGADVKQVEGKPHFLCARCGGSSRPVMILVAALAAVALAAAAWYFLRSPDDGAPEFAEISPWDKETLELMSQKKFPAVMERISQRLRSEPEHAGINGLMGQCLSHLSRQDEALPYFRKAAELDPERRASWGIWTGLALQKIGHSAEALPLLEAPTPYRPLELMRQESLLECVIDLERFDDALRMLDSAEKRSGHLTARHRSLCYLGRTEEARKLLEGLQVHQRGTLVASQLRETGDFDAAFKEVEAIKAGHAPPGSEWVRVTRSELSICAESGDLERLDRVAAELARVAEFQPRGTAILYRALGRLMAGKPDDAKAHARDFLATVDATYSPLRLERMMMRHLLGELKTADLEAEGKKVSRFLANDLYWYLALATGDQAWARKAAEATPGRNFPYHAIRRLLKE